MRCQALNCKNEREPEEFYCQTCLSSFKEGKSIYIKENGIIKQVYSCAYENCENPRGINSIFCFKHLIKEFFFNQSLEDKSRKDIVYEFIKKKRIVRRKEIASFLEVKTQHLSYSLTTLLKKGTIKRIKNKGKTYYLIKN